MAKMRSEKVSEARRKGNDKYDAKTYKRIQFALRLQDDADIIKDIESAKGDGQSLREWLRDLYDRADTERIQAEQLYQQLIEQYPHEADLITKRWKESPTLRTMWDVEAAMELFG